MEEIASVWARALFEVADDRDKLDEVREQLGQFADALSTDQQLQVFFFSPYFSTQEKIDGLHKAVEDAEPVFMNTLEALVEKHRMPALFRIRRIYDGLWEEYNKLLPVRITSAVELDESTVKAIGDRIAEQTGRKVELAATVDPDILGGLQVRVGNTILDATIRHRLDQLRREVSRAA
jgi:F-type H+-transporting ATPase subunit delta